MISILTFAAAAFPVLCDATCEALAPALAYVIISLTWFIDSIRASASAAAVGTVIIDAFFEARAALLVHGALGHARDALLETMEALVNGRGNGDRDRDEECGKRRSHHSCLLIDLLPPRLGARLLFANQRINSGPRRDNQL